MGTDPLAGGVTGAVPPIRVAIVDDHPVVIEGVCSWLAGEPRLRVVSTGADPEALLGP